MLQLCLFFYLSSPCIYISLLGNGRGKQNPNCIAYVSLEGYEWFLRVLHNPQLIPISTSNRIESCARAATRIWPGFSGLGSGSGAAEAPREVAGSRSSVHRSSNAWKKPTSSWLRPLAPSFHPWRSARPCTLHCRILDHPCRIETKPNLSVSNYHRILPYSYAPRSHRRRLYMRRR